MVSGMGAAATWTQLTKLAPVGTGIMLQLTDGTVMVKTGKAAWSCLSPSTTGSYADGTWSSLASRTGYGEPHGEACQAHGVRLAFGGSALWPARPAYGERLESFEDLHRYLEPLATR